MQEDATARIRLRFPDEGVEAGAVLLEEEAPALCEAIRAILPIRSVAHHAIYSGSEVAMDLDPPLMLPPSNQTLRALPGDVAFYCLAGGLWQGFPRDLSEVLVVYDRDGLPSMPWGPVPICLFARIDTGLDAFAAVCLRMRTEPHKRLVIEAVGHDLVQEWALST
jgi:hypothetical protein